MNEKQFSGSTILTLLFFVFASFYLINVFVRAYPYHVIYGEICCLDSWADLQLFQLYVELEMSSALLVVVFFILFLYNLSIDLEKGVKHENCV